MKKMLVLLALVSAVAVSATAVWAGDITGGITGGSGAASTCTPTDDEYGGCPEQVFVQCNAEYPVDSGSWFGSAITPDTPPFLAFGPDTGPLFALGPGEGVFTADGGMQVTCAGVVRDENPPFSGSGRCVAIRGGDEHGHGARQFAGEGVLTVTAEHTFTLTCNGAFTGILT